MRWSKYFLYTLKETPKEAEIISHIYLIRAGFIRKLASGIYNYMPIFLRTLKKLEKIIREELDKKGAIELLMPVVLPAELWKESGRWYKYGKELWRIKDRKDAEFALGPTHEEIITHIVRTEVSSYRDLPLNLYQIQTKVRDEIRPRFGLMRAREFIMKDGYSFHSSWESLNETYNDMYEAYSNIFKRCGLYFKVVEADTGNIGGSDSHEFMVLADTGEDKIANCKSCDYAANVEKAYTKFNEVIVEDKKPLELIETPDKKSIDELEEFLNLPPEKFMKAFLVEDEEGILYMFLIRGDYEINEAKINNIIGKPWKMATFEALKEANIIEGYAGPIGANLDKVKIFVDYSVRTIVDGITGANKQNYHYKGFYWDRDLPENIEWVNIHVVKPADKCPICGGELEIIRGIEVGHIFKLGTKYSESMKAYYKDKDGKEKPFIMGCYGIGVTRVIQAAIEQNHDENGIIWTKELAPFLIDLILLDLKDEETRNFADNLYKELTDKGFEVIYDDRDARAGFKFKDADLIGFPIHIIIGKKNLKQGLIEIKNRQTQERVKVKVEDFWKALEDILQNIR